MEISWLIHGARVFDGRNLLDGLWDVVLAGRQIHLLEATATTDASLLEEARARGRLIEAEGRLLLPGLIDLHVHLVWSGGPDPAADLRLEEREDTLLRAVGHGLRHLECGITTVRDLGSVDDLAIALSRGVERGWVPGPRVVASGRSIIMTGGHDPFWGLMVDGPQEALKAVRTQVYAGAGVIKVSATGGVYGRPTGEAVDDVELLPEELRVIAEQAHRMGLKVAAHAIGQQGIENCLEAGIDTIEHGHFLTEQQAQRMARQGTALVPTLYVYRRLAEAEDVPSYARAKAREITESHRRAVELALRAGVLIGAGSDAGSPRTPHPSLIEELECLVDAGLSPSQALTAATADAARILGLEDQIGRVAQGLRADLVLVDGDPLRNIGELRRRTHVFGTGCWFGASLRR